MDSSEKPWGHDDRRQRDRGCGTKHLELVRGVGADRVGLGRLGVTPSSSELSPALFHALETMVWDGNMAACLTPSLRSTWPALPRVGTIQGRCSGWCGYVVLVVGS